ncbi:interleukin 12 receptor, beta 2a, like isoform X2 [Corythoichthys intestinalis]|uniref:interleukin 12 receptor, beta 2a, like isoform X2 n=1 Tax=Corythoichthys intestinalis TaxID=161448 RepID=UPI0025A52C09|nr:interleukin 12 receptor, beta 2a, like isoform X2 [Corythoichthys intestinalis]
MDPEWLLLILIGNMSISFALEGLLGPPYPPSKPECHIPCDEICGVDIHCNWNHRFDPRVSTNYSLHWETAHNVELPVWVQAESKYGSAKSQVVVFNTGNLVKPSPPIFTRSQQDPLEISWKSICNLQSHLSLGSCDVRFRNEVEQFWREEEIGGQVNYEFSGPVRPGLVYEFQVRCSCATGLKSNWSATHKIMSFETAPTGQIDVWKDCGVSATNNDCVMTWKKIPISQAHGQILGYEVKLSSNHNMTELVNISIAEPRGLLVCDEHQCYLNSSLKSVSSASVLAYNAHGATMHSYLAIPEPGKARGEDFINVTMNTENLTISWDPSFWLPDAKSIDEYVVQYKQAGCHLGKGFDWIRVNKSCTSVTFTGQFEKYRPYQVSLFTVRANQQSHHISSVIGYSSHGIPAKVPLFKVNSIAATHATLLWEPVPLDMQNGLILYYKIGIHGKTHGKTVYNVSASPQDGNKTLELLNLSANQEYEVWIQAVTAAGPGANVTTSFITTQPEHLELKSKSHLLAFLLLPAIICCLLILFSFHKGADKACLCINEKVPDPYNSTIFKMTKYRMNDTIPWIWIPINEPPPTMSILEVVEIQCPVCEQDCLSEDQTRPAAPSKRCTCRTNRYSGDEYREMVDSEEEKSAGGGAGRDDCWSSSEEEQDMSGYEQHFMPTAVDILNA